MHHFSEYSYEHADFNHLESVVKCSDKVVAHPVHVQRVPNSNPIRPLALRNQKHSLYTITKTSYNQSAEGAGGLGITRDNKLGESE